MKTKEAKNKNKNERNDKTMKKYLYTFRMMYKPTGDEIITIKSNNYETFKKRIGQIYRQHVDRYGTTTQMWYNCNKIVKIYEQEYDFNDFCYHEDIKPNTQHF